MHFASVRRTGFQPVLRTSFKPFCRYLFFVVAIQWRAVVTGL
jgi:hypothetical protein